MITFVEKNSIAHEMGVEPGDRLVSINGQAVKDVFDFRYLQKEELLTVVIAKPDGEEWELEIEKDEDEELGLSFGSGLMDEPEACRNKCVFCFIDQLPKGLRPTLYFKDDDARLGFLSGNYVTLTNMGDAELDRVIFYHLSPVNISVHTADPALRVKMLRNPNAAKIMGQIEKLCRAGIEVNFQIVLCKGINDGGKLDESIAALSGFIPQARSLSVVPVGLTAHRGGLPELEPFSRADAAAVLEQTEGWQRKLKKSRGTSFVFAADEFYLLAGRGVPPAGAYEGFPQIENGVGMTALFSDEFTKALKRRKAPGRAGRITVVTGTAAHGFISGLAKLAEGKFPGLDIRVAAVENKFLGRSITVSGLLPGRDILDALRGCGHELGGRVLIPQNALRVGDTVFLDDMDISGLSQALGVPAEPVGVSGREFLGAVLG